MRLPARRLLVPFIWVLFCAVAAQAQTSQVEGIVVDARTGKGLQGVNILIVGTGWGTVSDAQGRFVLSGRFSRTDTVEFSHIGYMSRRVMLDSLRILRRIELVPTLVKGPEVRVEAEREMLISRDLPAAVTVLPMRGAASRGVDLADVLRRDPSLAISETSSGEKFVSIRGGNPDEVLVVYDGIRLNSSASNTFDLSQIALTNLARVELIKGSNTVLFGDGAFGGVLHIVPKKEFDRSISVSQRFGTFRANDLSLTLNKTVGRFSGSYTLSRRQADRTLRESEVVSLLEPPGAVSRRQVGQTGQDAERRTALTNDNLFHTLWLRYRTGALEVSGRYIRISNDFENRALLLKTDAGTDIFAGTVEGRIRYFGHLGMSVVRRGSGRTTRWQPVEGRQALEDLDDSGTILRVFKRDVLGEVRLYFSYERAWYGLDGLSEMRTPPPGVSLRSLSDLRRRQDAVIFVIQNHLDLQHKAFRFLDWDLSARIDWMSDQRLLRTEAGNAFEVSRGSTPRDAFLTYKFGFNGTGEVRGVRYRAYITNGANVKFPTLEQQFRVDIQPLYQYRGGILDPERNIGTEAGVHIEKPLPHLPTGLRIRRVWLDVAVFRNSYLNKIAEILIPLVGTRTPFNTRHAFTTGSEVQAGASLFNGLADLTVGYLGLNIDDPRVFQFKPENKVTLNLSVKRQGFSFWSSFFYEGTQTALLLIQGRVSREELPSRWDIDLAVRQSIPWRRINGTVGLSINNLRNAGESDPAGLFLRDRRWYVTFGVEL